MYLFLSEDVSLNRLQVSLGASGTIHADTTFRIKPFPNLPLANTGGESVIRVGE